MYKFLLVEDSLSDVEAFQTTIKRMNRGNGQTIYELVIAESVDKAMEKSIFSIVFCHMLMKK